MSKSKKINRKQRYTPVGKLPRYVLVAYRSSVGVVFGIIEVTGVHGKHNKPIAYNVMPYLSHKEESARKHMLWLEEKYWKNPSDVYWTLELFPEKKVKVSV